MPSADTVLQHYDYNKGEWIDDDSSHRWHSYGYLPSRCKGHYGEKCVCLQLNVRENGHKSYRCSLYKRIEDCCVGTDGMPYPHLHYVSDKLVTKPDSLCQQCIHARRYEKQNRYDPGAEPRRYYICVCAGANSYNANCQCHTDEATCGNAVLDTGFSRYHEPPPPPKEEHELTDEELEYELLGRYPVRPKYHELYQELKDVYYQRKELWAKFGIEHGMRFVEETVVPENMYQLADFRGVLKCPYVSIGLNSRSTVERDLIGNNEWRVNMRPGAMIAAARCDDKQGFNGSSCACFGYEGGYEPTSLQMAFDPHLIVLEPMSGNKKKKGFMFVFVGSTGFHAYGGCYYPHPHGFDISNERAKRIAEQLSRIANNWITGREDENNRVLDALNSMNLISVPYAYYMSTPDDAQVQPEGEYTGIEIWNPLQATRIHNRCYTEHKYLGGYFKTGITELVRPYSEEFIHDKIVETGLYMKAWRICGICGKTMTEKDRDDGNYCDPSKPYGISDLLCTDPSCLAESMKNHATDTFVIEDKTVVILNGKHFFLPEAVEEAPWDKEVEDDCAEEEPVIAF